MEIKDLRQLAGLSECGMTPAAPINPPSPATVSMTAASGSELSGMLKDIMSLAGMTKVEPAQLGVAPPPMKMTAEPVKAVGPAASDGEVMRGIADKLNLDGDDEEKKADEAWDNAPADAEPEEAFDAEEYAHHENPPGAGKGRGTMQPNATLEDIVASLNEEYAAFKNAVAEDEEVEEAADEEVEEDGSKIKAGSVRDLNRQRQAAYYAKGGGRAQPGHGAAPAKTGKGDVMRQASSTKSELGKQDYKGKEDDFSENAGQDISDEGITDDNERIKVVGFMGQTRYLISQFVNKLVNDPDSENLPIILDSINAEVDKIIQHADRKPGLYKNNPTSEFRIINDAAINILRKENNDYITKLLNSKQVDKLKNLMIAAEKHLLKQASAIDKSMGRPQAGPGYNSYFAVNNTFSENADNNIVINGKQVDKRSIEVDGVDPRDYGDFADAYASYATFVDGTELNDDELIQLTDEYGDVVNELAHDSMLGAADYEYNRER